jgi:phosphate acetyltransferase
MPPFDLAQPAVAVPPKPMPARPHLQAIIDAARAGGPIALALAYPCDRVSLESAGAAERTGLASPLLVGPRRRIEALAAEADIDLSRFTLHDTADDPRAAAAEAAALCRAGRAAALMKGSLHSDDLLAAAVSREAGLRTERRASHVFVLDVPGLGRPLLITDCVVNIAPTLMDKRDIAQSAIELAQVLGIATPRVAILSAVETVNPAIPGTIDAAALCKMADRGQIRGGVLDGPLAFDNAICAQSAHHKGITSLVAGRPDVLLVPSLEAGNMVYKQLVYMAGSECAGLVLGLRVPIVLTSRSVSLASRIASCAMAVLMSRSRRSSQAVNVERAA